MKNIMTVILPRSKGFKAFVWGQPDGHIMDWAGCNYHFMPIEGQAQRGYPTPQEAIAAVHALFPTEDSLRRWANGAGDGQFMTDKTYAQRVCDDQGRDIEVYP